MKIWTLTTDIRRRLGWRGAVTYLLYERLANLSGMCMWHRRLSNSEGTYSLSVRNIQHPILCRPKTSDRWAFGQVFVRQEYGSLPTNMDPAVIIDCGANVGYTSVDFLSRFPHARIIAVEPDERSFEILQRNLAPYGDRARAIHAALWSTSGGLKLRRPSDQFKNEWASWVSPCEPGELPDTMAIDLNALMEREDVSHIGILKIDIEGAEAEVFTRNYDSWIDKVDVFLIELHGAECEEIFQRTLHRMPYSFSQHGEVTIAHRALRSDG